MFLCATLLEKMMYRKCRKCAGMSTEKEESATLKSVSLRPHSIQPFIEVTLVYLLNDCKKMDELLPLYDLIINTFHSSSVGWMKKL